MGGGGGGGGEGEGRGGGCGVQLVLVVVVQHRVRGEEGGCPLQAACSEGGEREGGGPQRPRKRRREEEEEAVAAFFPSRVGAPSSSGEALEWRGRMDRGGGGCGLRGGGGGGAAAERPSARRRAASSRRARSARSCPLAQIQRSAPPTVNGPPSCAVRATPSPHPHSLTCSRATTPS